MYAYAQVEAALASIFYVREASKAAFKGRIKHFQKLGLVPASPGKGKRIQYSFDDAWRWAVALNFCEFGIDPIEIDRILKVSFFGTWRRIIDQPDSGEDRFYVISPRFMSASFQKGNTQSGEFHTHVVPSSEISAGMIDMVHHSGRALIFNFSRLRRNLKDALDATEKERPKKVDA
jgi:hypothetical protein